MERHDKMTIYNDIHKNRYKALQKAEDGLTPCAKNDIVTHVNRDEEGKSRRPEYRRASPDGGSGYGYGAEVHS